MTPDDRLDRLVERWRELSALGRPPSLTELCAECPDLIDELRRRLSATGGSATEATLAPDAAAPSVVSPETVAPSGGAAADVRVPAPPNYEILGEVGRGGMGVVYRARQLALDRVVALKMILHGDHAGEAEVARFRREAEAIARLQHPNIVQVFDVGQSDGKTFLALEFCEGGGLDERLRGTPLEAKAAAQLVRTLAEAVRAAHQAKVIHRDLKPANVLLTEDGTPKITDFGLAKKTDEAGQTQTGAVMGTPSYMPPEQALGKKDLGPAADVYSLGAILYECLTGRPPFRAATALDTLALVVNEEPVSPSRLAKVPRDLETVCLKCLRKEPEKRYAEAAELADDLGRFIDGEPVRARPVRTLEKGRRWVRRRPMIAGLLAAMVVLTAAALVVITVLYGDAVAEAKKAQKAERLAENEREKAVSREKEARQQKERAESEKIRAEKEWGRAEWMLSASQIQSAQREWEAGRVELAWQHLIACRGDFRNFEHRYLTTLFTRNQVTLRAHTDDVRAVAFSPDGSQVASGSSDKTVIVCDARTGEEMLTLQMLRGWVESVGYSPDGSRIASGSGDGMLKVWDVQTGRELFTCKHTASVNAVAYSPDGACIASVGDTALMVWDARTGRKLVTLKGDPKCVNTVAYSPDCSRVASGGDEGTLKVWDARTGRELLTLKGHAGGVNGVAYSPDGSRLASAGGDATLKVWDACTGGERLTLTGHQEWVNAVAYSPDGSRLASAGSDGTVKVWDARTGEDVLTMKGHAEDVNTVAYSPDGLRFVSGSFDGT